MRIIRPLKLLALVLEAVWIAACGGAAQQAPAANGSCGAKTTVAEGGSCGAKATSAEGGSCGEKGSCGGKM